MTDNKWQWANLSEDQLRLLREAEQSLGADVLLAFQGASEAPNGERSLSGLQAATLNDSQMECLRGTEDRLSAVVVAYKQTSA